MDTMTRDESLGQRKDDEQVVAMARNTLRTMKLPGIPTVEVARIVIVNAAQSGPDALGAPYQIGDGRHVSSLRISSGNPFHREYRSDDHIARFTVEFPLHQWNRAVEDDSDPEITHCPECGSHRGRYSYSAFHHISGSATLKCLRCGHILQEKRWG